VAISLTTESDVLLVALGSRLILWSPRTDARLDHGFKMDGRPAVRLNEGRADPGGNFWIGSMCNNATLRLPVLPHQPVFLDAECACYGDPAFDVAFFLNHLLLKSVAMHRRSALLLDAFDAFIEAYSPSVQWEPRRDFEGRVASLLPALTLARISGKSPVEYLDDSMRKAIVRVASPLVSTPRESLEALKRHWKNGFDI
jgi:hypothetical protein